MTPDAKGPAPRAARRPIFASILVLAAAASLGGCVSLLPKAKPAQLYRFGDGAPSLLAAPPENVPAAPRTGVVLATIGFTRAATSDGILTVTGDETAYLAGVRWIAPARLLFQEAVQRAFAAHAARAQLVNVGDVGSAGAILRIDVTDFEARYQGSGGAPAVVVSLSARLTRSDGQLLDQRAFTTIQPAEANSVSAIVRGFDQATGKTLSDLTAWTDVQLARIPPPAPSRSASPLPAGPGVSTYSHSSSTTITTTPPPPR